MANLRIAWIFALLLLATAGVQGQPDTGALNTDPVQKVVDLGNSFGIGQAMDDFLHPDKAFQFTAEARDAHTIDLQWIIADGHYLYGDKFKIGLEDVPGVAIREIRYSPGEIKEDEFFGRVEVHHRLAEAVVLLERSAPAAAEVTLTATYQGCAEAGICYPPINKTTTLMLARADTPAPQDAAAAPAGSPAALAGDDTAPVSEQDRIARSLMQGNAWVVVLSFFGFGLLLAFTPCVFPMIPILSSILVGQGHTLTMRRGLGYSLIYVLAMALTYTFAGVLAGLFGQNLQATFQNPWVLSAFAAIFVLLALSMFGFYKLQVPASIQSRLTEISNRQQGGTVVGVAIMGFLSALIVGPCVAAPLAGALIYIGQTGDAVLGGLALFALSMGMGMPLLALGAGAGKLLPKAGTWMNTINAVFGVLLLALAIWLLERILPGAVIMALWAVLLVVSSVYMGSLDSLGPDASGWRRLWKGIGLVMLVCGVILLIGAASGGRDMLQPLKGFGMSAQQDGAHRGESSLAFRHIKSAADLERELQAAVEESQYVMLDFYADWCVACKELEKYTFSEESVRQALADVRLLQADVTAYDSEDRALLKKLELIGPPSILFYGPDGRERRNFRLVGFMKAEEFLDHVNRLKSI